jgi:hypothetical protein
VVRDADTSAIVADRRTLNSQKNPSVVPNGTETRFLSLDPPDYTGEPLTVAAADIMSHGGVTLHCVFGDNAGTNPGGVELVLWT